MGSVFAVIAVGPFIIDDIDNKFAPATTKYFCTPQAIPDMLSSVLVKIGGEKIELV